MLYFFCLFEKELKKEPLIFLPVKNLSLNEQYTEKKITICSVRIQIRCFFSCETDFSIPNFK